MESLTDNDDQIFNIPADSHHLIQNFTQGGRSGAGENHNTGEVHEMLAAFEEGALSYKERQIEDDKIEHGIT